MYNLKHHLNLADNFHKKFMSLKMILDHLWKIFVVNQDLSNLLSKSQDNKELFKEKVQLLMNNIIFFIMKRVRQKSSYLNADCNFGQQELNQLIFFSIF